MSLLNYNLHKRHKTNMKHNDMTLFIVVMLSIGNVYAISNHDRMVNEITNTKTIATQTFVSSQSDNGWLEVGDISMCAYFDECWHWATATLYKLENSNLAYRVCCEDKYYTVIARMEDGETKCSVLIPYQGEKRWFSFSL